MGRHRACATRPSGIGGAEPGDVMVEIHVKPHPLFRREGNDIHSSLPVTLGERRSAARRCWLKRSLAPSISRCPGAPILAPLRLRGRALRPRVARVITSCGAVGNPPRAPDEELIRSVVEGGKHPLRPTTGEGAAS
jgi:hypothetical protein